MFAKFSTINTPTHTITRKRLALRLAGIAPIILLASCATQNGTTASTDDLRDVFPQPTVVHGTASAKQTSPQAALPEVSAATIRKWAAQQDRLSTLAAPLLLKNADICKPKSQETLGATVQTRHAYSPRLAELAQSELGLDERLRIVSIMPGSGAEKAGLQRGDILLQAANRKLPSGPSADRDAAKLMQTMMQGRSSLKLLVLRGSEQLAFDVPRMSACAVSVKLGDSDAINSYADGRRVLITRGMVNYAQSDAELSYAIAKEIAHAVLMRPVRADMQAAIDRLSVLGGARNAAGSMAPLKPYLPVMDATADKFALYLLARAGHDIDGVLPFWKRLAGDYPASVPDGHTALHPSSNYRFSVMRAVGKVIEHTQKHKWPLIPN